MSGNPHPAAAVYPTGLNVSKADVIAANKRKVWEVPDANEIRNGDWSGQFAPLFMLSTDAFFLVDATDTTTADDGVNVIVDANGLRFKRTTPVVTLTTRTHIAAGAVTVTSGDVDVIFVNKTVGAATVVNLPPSASRTKPVRIVDRKYDATTNPLTITPNGAETVMGGTTYVIDFSGGGITLTPLADGTGWY